ncbi:MAG: tetratricopeptide repeat protein [Lentisphaerae bacterium]|nr:tetratricopeptide repeat protein [Lentisphaerota bacterium]
MIRNCGIWLVTLTMAFSGIVPTAFGELLTPDVVKARALGALWTQSVTQEEEGDLNAALKSVEEFGLNGGDTYLARLRTAWLLRQKGEYQLASVQYKRAIGGAPNAINAALGLLSCQEALEDTRSATTTAESILRVHPNNYRALLRVGSTHYEARRYSSAKVYFERAVKAYPEDPAALSHLAWTYYYSHRKSDAAKVFRRLVSLDPDFPYATRGLALCTGASPNGKSTYRSRTRSRNGLVRR